MIDLESSSRIMVVVSTYNRRDLTGQCLDSLARCKSPWTQVVILDDASTEFDRDWLSLWGFPVHRRMKSIGVGLAAKSRIDFFLSIRKEFQFLIACDNDISFVDLFDLRMRSTWEFANDRKSLILMSGFNSVTYDVLSEHAGYDQVYKIGGACQFMDRTTAQAIVDRLPPEEWNGGWDTHISRLPGARCIVPKKSLVQHHGNYGNGHNGRSWNIASDLDSYSI